MNFDELISTIGGFGKYQKLLYIWICLPQVLLALHMMVSIFTEATPPHQCRGDSGNHSLFIATEKVNFSLPELSCAPLSPLRNQTERVPCGRAWVYSRDTFQSTTVTEVSCSSVLHTLRSSPVETAGEFTTDERGTDNGL